MKKTYMTGIAVVLAAAIVAGLAGMNFYAKRHFVEDRSEERRVGKEC